MGWDMISWGSQWIDSQRRLNMAVRIDYERDGKMIFTATDVTPAKSWHKVMIDTVEVEINCQDFIVPSHYFSDHTFLPSPGDRILMVTSGKMVRYRVTAYPGTEEVYRQHDRYRLALRIHTIVDEVQP